MFLTLRLLVNLVCDSNDVQCSPWTWIHYRNKHTLHLWFQERHANDTLNLRTHCMLGNSLSLCITSYRAIGLVSRDKVERPEQSHFNAHKSEGSHDLMIDRCSSVMSMLQVRQCLVFPGQTGTNPLPRPLTSTTSDLRPEQKSLCWSISGLPIMPPDKASCSGYTHSPEGNTELHWDSITPVTSPGLQTHE